MGDFAGKICGIARISQLRSLEKVESLFNYVVKCMRVNFALMLMIIKSCKIIKFLIT